MSTRRFAPHLDERGLSLKLALPIAAISGGVLSLAFPGWEASFLAWFALAPLLTMLITRRSTVAYATISGAFGFGFFGGLNYWLLAMHPLTWVGPQMTPGLSLAVVAGAWALLATVLALGAVAALTGAAWVMRRLSAQGRLNGWLAVITPTCFWVALEVFQAAGPFGYPWGVLALTQYQHLPLLQTIALVGSFPLSGFIVAVNAALAWGLVRREWRPLIACASVALAGTTFGAWWMARPVEGAPVPVAVVQGNTSQTEKWTKGNEQRLLELHAGLMRRAADARLVVWPETALPVVISERPELEARLADTIKSTRQYVLTGAFQAESPTNGPARYYNATLLFAPTGELVGWDAKKHLVPFGEYLPWREVLPAWWSGTFSQLNLLRADLTPGERPRPFQTAFGRVGANVCFDSIFPAVMRDTTRAGAEMLVLVTNDGWYKRTMALRQHLAHGVLRAVENRRPFVQGANTGVSGVVDHTGRILATAPTWEPAVTQAGVVPVSETTPYTRWGDWMSWLLIGGGLALTAWAATGPRFGGRSG